MVYQPGDYSQEAGMRLAPDGGMSAEVARRWAPLALAVVAVLMTALAWSGLSLRDLLVGLIRFSGQFR
jgi:hypothetical protein